MVQRPRVGKALDRAGWGIRKLRIPYAVGLSRAIATVEQSTKRREIQDAMDTLQIYGTQRLRAAWALEKIHTKELGHSPLTTAQTVRYAVLRVHPYDLDETPRSLLARSIPYPALVDEVLTELGIQDDTDAGWAVGPLRQLAKLDLGYMIGHCLIHFAEGKFLVKTPVVAYNFWQRPLKP